MMLAPLRKDTSNAFLRIFDHRSFVNSEIEIALNNFESIRRDKEVEKLFKAAQTVSELKFTLSDKFIDLSNSRVSSISKTINNCLCSFKTLDRESNQADSSLEHSKRKRKEQEVLFCNQLAYKYMRVQNTFEDKEEEITEIYNDLELKLSI